MKQADTPYVALTIAGSDSSGGAGIQADLKSFAAFGVHGASVITAVTAQNTTTVQDIYTLPLSSIEAQLDAVFSDMPIQAIKIGMIGSPSIAALVGRYIRQANVDLVVVDTPLMSGTGAALGCELVRSALVEHVFPLANIITPNLYEAGLLLEEASLNCENLCSDHGREAFLSNEAIFQEAVIQFEDQARRLLELGPRSVLLKGGHFYDVGTNANKKSLKVAEKQAIDVFYNKHGSKVFVSDWVDVMHHHGTGCALSSAITANLIYSKYNEKPDEWAVEKAKAWVHECLHNSGHMSVGKGAGPLNIANLRKIDL